MLTIPKNSFILVLLHLAVIFLNYSNGFNLSPKPNIIFKEPNLPTAQQKLRSSYFGFSINLRSNSIIVGAPRAQSTVPAQQANNETGAIYQCKLDTGNCLPYIFDHLGNILQDGDFTHDIEIKNHQWLGMALDGNSDANEKIVVCAPRVLTDIINDHLMFGVCYWSPNSTDEQPMNVRKIAALRLKGNTQYTVNVNGKTTHAFHHAFGQQGISVHVTENNEEIIIGAPGVHNWCGSIIRYKQFVEDDIGGLSRRRRDVNVDDQTQIEMEMENPSPVVDQPHLNREKRNIISFRSDVPNPMNWQQQQDSYLGYAVSSGRFEGPNAKRILYVASAPRTNLQQGEVYIFDIVPFTTTVDTTIKIYYKFMGNNIGEFFGFALLTEDFNNDGYPDIAIAAPFHAKRSSYESGTVYTYLNLGATSDGKWSENFEIGTTLTSNYDGPGRFGTAISKIGDINQDGYNDIAVGAPYEGNGAVYIYLGGSNGLIQAISQRIEAPINEIINDPNIAPIPAIFGYSVSKGVDVDGNNYYDLAIGSPNREIVYLYKSYPVVKVKVSLISEPTMLQAIDSTFKLNACWSFYSKYPIQTNTNIYIKLVVDGQIGRAKFSNDLNQMEFNTSANSLEQCRKYDLSVKSSLNDIYKPIDLDMHYEVLDKIPDSEVFCQNCVAVNPTDPTILQNKLVFSTGCQSIICIADLKIQSNVDGLTETFIIGSSKSLVIEYAIRNNGETAFLTSLDIIVPEFVTYAKIPWNCLFTNTTLQCNLNNGNPLFNGEETLLQIAIDMTKLDGSTLPITAIVSSSSQELNEADNVIQNVIELKEFSDIEISGKASKSLLSLQDGLRVENLTHVFEIRNNGPSNLREADIFILIPISYLNEWTLEWIHLIDHNTLSLKAQYNNQFLTVTLLQNEEILIQNPDIPIVIPVPIMHSPDGYDSSHIGMDYGLAGGESSPGETQDIYRRRKRFISDEMNYNRFFNRYTQNVQETQHHRNRRSVQQFQDDTIISNLPINRTILWDCHEHTESALCIKGKFSVHNFKSGNNPIMVSYAFNLDLKKIDKVLTDNRDIFVIRTIAILNKTDDVAGSTIEIMQTSPYTIITKYLITSTPIWVYIVSIIGGLLTLILITYALYRFGFFKRAKKEEMEKLVRESIPLTQPLNQPSAETDNE